MYHRETDYDKLVEFLIRVSRSACLDQRLHDACICFACTAQRLRHEIHDEAAMYQDDDRSMFHDPYGRSALRASSRRNPRNLPCPTCGAADRLTPADRAKGYQCDVCADRAEGVGF